MGKILLDLFLWQKEAKTSRQFPNGMICLFTRTKMNII